MTAKRTGSALGCLALATCCPTLWLQMTKTEPAPWPEVPTPVATAPVVPANMPNRFDVLERGRRILFAEGYRDEIDARDDAPAQKARALGALQAILARYHDPHLASCGAGTTMTAHVFCAQAGAQGPSANCNSLLVDTRPANAATVVVKGQARTVGRADPHPRTHQWIVPLGERIDAADGEQVEACFMDALALSTPLLSFIHMSDIQLRDPSVVLTDRALSRRLDWFDPLNSAEYDEDLAFYNQYLFESVVATINAAAGPSPGGDPARPSFAIHTGDSVDASTMSELRRFHAVIDRLRIPFYELLGNHDVLVFGNLTPTDQVAAADDRKCTPVASLLGSETWLAPHKICVDVRVKPCATCTAQDVELIASPRGHAETRKRFMDALVHSAADPVAQPAAPMTQPGEPGEYCADTAPRVMKTAYSRAHGFDLGTADDTLVGPRLGYYAMVQPLVVKSGPARNAVFISLNGQDLADYHGGVGGHIGHVQLAWLQRVLACVQRQHARDLVFVSAHQPLGSLSVDPVDAARNVEATLRGSPNVVGYLYGHHHQHAICDDRRVDAKGERTTCTRFWEIETASLVEFPQEARMIRIKQVGERMAFLEVSTFGEQLVEQDSQVARYVQLARRGAERDHCLTHDVRCSADLRPYRTDGNATSARLFFRLP